LSMKRCEEPGTGLVVSCLINEVGGQVAGTAEDQRKCGESCCDIL
jgi:hypothetical protein